MLRGNRSYLVSFELRRDECGATLIEFTFTFPLLLLSIASTLLFAQLYLAQTTLSSSLGKARLAYTRGGDDLAHLQIMDAVAQFKQGNITPEFKRLFASQDISGAQRDAFYNQIAKTVYHPTSGSAELPDPILYLYAYIHSEMTASFGKLSSAIAPLRFPCEPATSGCLKCVPIFPKSELSAYGPSGAKAPWLDASAPYPPDIAGMECSYRIGNVFVDPVLGMLRVITGGNPSDEFVLRRRYIFRAGGF